MRYIIYAIIKVSSSNQIEVPLYFSKHYGIVAGDEISWTNTEGGRILLKIEKKVTEDDIIGLIKSELPYNCVEIKKRGSKGLKWDNLRFADIS